jgi:hypothetical protein
MTDCLFGKFYLHITCIWLLAMCSPTSSHSQKLALGVKSGPLVLWTAYGDRDDRAEFDSQAKAGFAVSGIIGFPLKKQYACIFEGGYSQRGRKVLFNNGFSQNDATYRFTDFSLLLQRSFRFNLSKNVVADWYFSIGPQISYWLNGDGVVGSVDNEGQAYTLVFDKPFTGLIDNKMYLNDVNRWLFGLNFGMGMQAPLGGARKLNLELRFISGHTYFGARNSASYSWQNFEDNLRANEKILTLTAAYVIDVDLRDRKQGRSTKDKEVKRKPVRKRKR